MPAPRRSRVEGWGTTTACRSPVVELFAPSVMVSCSVIEYGVEERNWTDSEAEKGLFEKGPRVELIPPAPNNALLRSTHSYPVTENVPNPVPPMLLFKYARDPSCGNVKPVALARIWIVPPPV